MKRTIALILLASALALLSGPSLPASGKALAEEAETDPYPWETCMTMGDQWSFKPGDRYKGGNFLLNIGPGPEGEFAPEAFDRLRGIGEWMKVNSEAIYGTGPEWLSGYGRTLSGVTMAYHSPYPDITSTLIVRASDGTMAMEWEPEPVPPGPVAMSLKPSVDGRAWVLRLLNASDRPEELRLSGQAFDTGRVFLSDLGETHGARVTTPLEVPALGILTLRIRR